MSDRLMNMKFMRRAAASEPKTKTTTANLKSNQSSASSPKSTSSRSAAVTPVKVSNSSVPATPIEEDKWMLSFVPPPNTVKTPSSLRFSNVVSVGFNEIGNTASSSDDDSEDDDNTDLPGQEFRSLQGRRSYGTVPKSDPKQDESKSDDSEASETSDESLVDLDEPPRKRTRKDIDRVKPMLDSSNIDIDLSLDEMPLTGDSVSSRRSSRRDDDPDSRSLRGVKSISGTGTGSLAKKASQSMMRTLECFRCGKVGHIAKQCPSSGSHDHNGKSNMVPPAGGSKPKSRVKKV